MDFAIWDAVQNTHEPLAQKVKIKHNEQNSVDEETEL